MRPHDPHSPAAEEWASYTHPHGHLLPLTFYLGSHIEGEARGGYANSKGWGAANQRP